MAQAKSETDDDLFLVDDEDDADRSNKFLLFKIGKETYGFSILFVTDIIEMQKITEVPDMPEYIKGVINLRGRVLPVMDLRLRFGMEARDYDDRTCIIILQHENTGLGIVVDTVSEVKDIAPSLISDPPEKAQSQGSSQYVAGLARTEDGVHILLDVPKTLARETDTDDSDESE